MGKGFFQVPTAINEPIKSYAPGNPEREAVLKQYKEYYNSKVDIPLYIGSEEIKTGNTKPLSPPHDHKHVVGHYHLAEKKHVSQAIKNSLTARNAWANLAWEQRAAIFLKAADLIAGPYRAKINAATMIAQSWNTWPRSMKVNPNPPKVSGTVWNTGPWKALFMPLPRLISRPLQETFLQVRP